MLFNSVDFGIFLPIIFILYWFVANHNLRLQNLLIVAASYFFYGCWDWRFLTLIIFSTVIDFWVGLKLSKEEIEKKRKVLLGTSLIVNLGFLGFFKYFNFFIENFVEVFSIFGFKLSANSLNIILPVGISFYTFQTLSYSIDVYKRKLNATTNFIAFSAFVSFFPQLVAGPIERASNLLPQFFRKRTFNYEKAVDGLRQILWGLFKKIAIADNCARIVNAIFENYQEHSASILVLGPIFFAFQIYGDFSGYSDIAIGTSRLFGFNLMRNFAFPYFSRDIAEFWRRWHISLSTWFRDYLYVPLGGSRCPFWKKIRNTFIVFVVSGFWHGANWTFIVWGALNAIYFLPLLIKSQNRKHLDVVAEDNFIPSFKELRQIFVTFSLTLFAWIFFRSNSLVDACAYIQSIFNSSIFTYPNLFELKGTSIRGIIFAIVFLVFFILVEWLGRHNEYAIEKMDLGFSEKIESKLRWCFYYALIMAVFLSSGNQQAFIYFQF
jgi:D-alanyl-lipoteichoic acid acyltransferase DltB (MBOAT superfamily)